MRILIAGANGQLGTSLANSLRGSHTLFLKSSKEMDVGNKESIFSIAKELKPDVIINCAAYNNVDLAELHLEDARRVNTIGPANLAEISNFFQIGLVHISTDYVFDGFTNMAYKESAVPNPLNIYGETKLSGEKEVHANTDEYTIIRTSWLYGGVHKNFFNAIVQAASKKSVLEVVNDQIGSPTNVFNLAECLVQIVEQEIKGLFHYSGAGSCSRFEFAKEIVESMRLSAEVIAVPTVKYPTLANRPAFSALDSSRLVSESGIEVPYWKDALSKYISSIKGK